MNKMKLNVPSIQQEPKSKTCGINCMEMVLKYFKREDLIPELTKIKVHSYGIYTAHISDFFQKNGFSTEVIFFSPELFTLKDENKISNIKIKSIFNKLCEGRKSNRKWVQLFFNTIDNGGKITVKIPTIFDIEKNISKNSLIICNLTTRFLINHKEPKTNLHFNVITGYDSKNIFVNDPASYFKDGRIKHNKENFLFSLHSIVGEGITSGCLIIIKKK